MIDNPILTIIVPHRQSRDYIFHTIENLMSCRSLKFEVVLNDNSAPEKFDFSRFKNDTRFKLFVEKKKLTMSQNWLSGLKKANGKYIIFLGSDDGCIPENLEILIAYLENCNFEAINTRHTFYQHPTKHRDAFVTIPSKSLRTHKKKYKYPILLSALFYSYRTWLPLPYGVAVVRRDVYKDLYSKYDEIPGVAPDDFLAHYGAQKIKSGVYIDLNVFITGSSEISNGHGMFSDQVNTAHKEFLDSTMNKLGQFTSRFGLYCLPAVNLEHFLLARSILGGAQNSSYNKIYEFLIFLINSNTYPHNEFAKKGRRYKINLVKQKIFIIIERSIKLIWKLISFAPYIPASNLKVRGDFGSIISAANFVYSKSSFRKIFPSKSDQITSNIL